MRNPLREQIAREALEVAEKAFLSAVTTGQTHDLTLALAAAISAYDANLWRPLAEGAPPTFRDVMVKDGYWRFKPFPTQLEQEDLEAPGATGPFNTA